nr:hypothetical protein [Tanacetum cinerariifolium]
SNRVNAVSAPVNDVGPNPTNSFNTASPYVNDVSLNFGIAGKSSFVDPSKYPDDPDMPELEDIVYSDDEEDVDVEADLSNLETNLPVSPIPTTRVYKNHPVNEIIGDLNSAPQIRSMTRMGHTQEEGIDYDEVFDYVARIEAIRLFLAYASFMDMPELEDIVYSDDEEDVGVEADLSNLETNLPVSPIPTTRVYKNHPVNEIIGDLNSAPQTRRFEDLDYPDKVYKVVKALYGLHQAPKAWYETLANYLLENGFQRGKIDQTLFIKKQ